MSELTHGSFDIRPESGGYDPPKDELVALRAKLEQCQIERDTISTDLVDARDELRAKLEQVKEDLLHEKQKVAELERALEETRAELKYTIGYYD